MVAPPDGLESFCGTGISRKRTLASLQKVAVRDSIHERTVQDCAEAANPRLYNCYGQSEISPLATVLRPDELTEERLASVGRPALLVETRVVDPEMNDAPPGERGEIVHRSPHLMTGYWEKPEETEEAFGGGWFHSGDLGYFDEEGYLYVVDRVKDVINTGGIQVSGSEVEDVLFDHEAVSEVAVIGLPDEKWIEAVAPWSYPKRTPKRRTCAKCCKNTPERSWPTSSAPSTSSSSMPATQRRRQDPQARAARSLCSEAQG